MTAKKRKIEAFSQPRGGFKKMFSAEDKALIRTLYAEKHVPIRCIAQMVHVSRNAVRRQIREEGKARAAGSAQRRGGISEGTCHRCSGAVSGVRNAVPAATSSAQQRLSARHSAEDAAAVLQPDACRSAAEDVFGRRRGQASPI